MDAEKLTRGLQIFVVGLGGVFLNLVLLMGAVKGLAWGMAVSERRKTAAKKEKEKQKKKE